MELPTWPTLFLSPSGPWPLSDMCHFGSPAVAPLHSHSDRDATEASPCWLMLPTDPAELGVAVQGGGLLHAPPAALAGVGPAPRLPHQLCLQPVRLRHVVPVRERARWPQSCSGAHCAFPTFTALEAQLDRQTVAGRLGVQLGYCGGAVLCYWTAPQPGTAELLV